MYIQSPRYLGPAVTDGGVYIGSQHDGKAEMICFRGNLMKFPDYSRATDNELEESRVENEKYKSRMVSRRLHVPVPAVTPVMG